MRKREERRERETGEREKMRERERERENESEVATDVFELAKKGILEFSSHNIGVSYSYYPPFKTLRKIIIH